MSVNIYWRHITPETRSALPCGGSAFVSAMERAFGSPPWTLTSEHVERLTGMMHAYGGHDRDNPYRALLERMYDGSDDHVAHPIEVWTEY